MEPYPIHPPPQHVLHSPPPSPAWAPPPLGKGSLSWRKKIRHFLLNPYPEGELPCRLEVQVRRVDTQSPQGVPIACCIRKQRGWEAAFPNSVSLWVSSQVFQCPGPQLRLASRHWRAMERQGRVGRGGVWKGKNGPERLPGPCALPVQTCFSPHGSPRGRARSTLHPWNNCLSARASVRLRG